jgi:thioredoxin-related protein
MRQLGAVLLALVLSFGLVPPIDAARETGTDPAKRLELLVIEVAGCTICDLVRIHIQPAYDASPRARQVPMRYVDITSVDEMRLGLAERVATVPTIVLMRDGREVDRITGYTGPQHFFVALSGMLETASD